MPVVPPVRSLLLVLGITLAAVACTPGATITAIDAHPYNTAIDTSIIILPHSPGLDASRESQGEAGPGEAGPASPFTLSPASVDLGRIQPGISSASQTVTVTATRDISDLSVALAGDELTLGTNGCGRTLVAGASCAVTFTFASPVIGVASATVTVGAGGLATVVPVTAYVLDDDALLVLPMTAQSFGAAIGQQSWPVRFSVPNLGDDAFGPVTYEITGANAADFAAATNGCERIAPRAACTILVVYAPTVASGLSASATLVVTGPEPDPQRWRIPLSGTVYAFDPIWLACPTSELGSVVVGGTGAPVTCTVRNAGDTATGPLASMVSNRQFVITDETCSTAVLPPDGTCTISVALRPTSAGTKTAALLVGLPAGSPAVKVLTGTGVADDAGVPDGGNLDSSIADTSDGAALDAGNGREGDAG